MSTRRGTVRGRARRRKIVWALGGMLLLGAAAAAGFARREHVLRRWQAAQAAAERARGEEAAAARAAALKKIARLNLALARLEPPPSRAGDLLAALARTTPPAIVLEEVACTGENFVIRGHVGGAGRGPDNPLGQFRRELCPPEAPWQISDPLSGPVDFTWHGALVRPPGPAADAAALEARLVAARAALRPAAAFDSWMQGWSRPWKLLARSAEPGPDLEVRHYALAYAHPRLRAWSDIVQTLALLGAEPGLTVDSLVLAAAPDGADAFTQAQLSLTARLRP